LDPVSLLQLVRVFLENNQPADAARAAKVAMTAEATALDDETRWQIATIVGPVMRYRLEQPREALTLWREVGQRIGRRPWRALCALEAADIQLHDLLRPADARPFLEYAAQRLEPDRQHALGRVHSLWGDWHARNGDATAARKSYEEAQRLSQARTTATQANAWRGAHSRSTESFLRQGELERAGETLRQWEQEYPADKCQGYLTLLRAKYWVARNRLPNAIAAANDLLTVNPASPYADQLLMLAGDCESQLGHLDRSRAVYQSLLDDYPGSPLVTEAKRKLEESPM
jgi:TolA-binding protein